MDRKPTDSAANEAVGVSQDSLHLFPPERPSSPAPRRTVLHRSAAGVRQHGTLADRAVWVVLVIFAFTFIAAAVYVERKNALALAVDRAQEERIAQSNRLAGEANERAARSQLDAAEAMRQQETLRAQNLILETNLERERSERLRLEARVAPRSISAEQRATIVRTLRPAPGQKFTAGIRVPYGTAESTRYADQLRAVFLAAGWNAPDVVHNMVAGVQQPSGVIVVATGQSSPSGALIRRAFQQSDVEAQYQTDPALPLDSVVIIVGQKPAQ